MPHIIWDIIFVMIQTFDDSIYFFIYFLRSFDFRIFIVIIGYDNHRFNSMFVIEIFFIIKNFRLLFQKTIYEF